MKELAKQYDPSQVEDRIYQFWQDGGYFHTEADPDKKPYTIVMPPPNVTGQLHMGHALDNTMQDVLIRTKRMQGYAALWVPGTDHASIATEAKVVEAMRAEGLTKEMVGRDGFLERAWDWKTKYGNRIVSQLKKLGTSCDWQRERFTMDEGCSDAVKEVFVRLYDKGLIYRGNRMVNWCPHCNTSISDAEVEYEEKDGSFWHLLYPVKETGEMLELATTRPETMLGDTAVAINGEDPRYAHLHGCHVVLPLLNKEIPIVCDEHADMTKGTGVVKITPAHDPNDFEVGLRHDLPIVRVFTYDGHMTGAADKAAADALFAAGKNTVNEPEVLDCGKYAGMTTLEARKAILADLKEGGFLKEIEPLKHEVGTCYRCHSTIEPMVSKQWFVKMEPLAKPAIESVEKGEIKFVPERFTKTYINWMENVHDWCISRQLWWGHQIPAWYCDDCGHINVSRQDPTKCEKCGCTHLTREEDVLDTWFSSALWPFSTLGWPEKTEDLDYFYPTDVLVTGYDIIFFWVARMMMMSMYMMKKVPFKKCYIHGLVRDEQGRKMSKSKGNTVDPMETIEKYGADALRFFMAAMETQGRDINMSENRIAGYRNFATKLWNAARFGEMNEAAMPQGFEPSSVKHAVNKWIIAKAQEATREVTENLNSYRFSDAANAVYQFVWGSFCDWYIEMIKPILYGENEAEKAETRAAFAWVRDRILVILHPFMPFITTELWNNTAQRDVKLIHAPWPQAEKIDTAAMEDIDWAIELIGAVRSLRAEMNLPAGAKLTVFLKDANDASCAHLKSFNNIICSLARLEKLECFAPEAEVSKDMVQAVFREAVILLPLKGVVDFAAEKERLQKEIAALDKNLEGYARKLGNPSFVERAPAAVVEEEKRRQSEALENKAKLQEALQRIANF